MDEGPATLGRLWGGNLGARLGGATGFQPGTERGEDLFGLWRLGDLETCWSDQPPGLVTCAGRVPPLSTHTRFPHASGVAPHPQSLARPAPIVKRLSLPSSSPIQISHPNSPIQTASRASPHNTTRRFLVSTLPCALHRRQYQVTCIASILPHLSHSFAATTLSSFCAFCLFEFFEICDF